ncbi:MAG: PhzF family phenazine biosynthesis protein [Calditrichia bacterium]
MEIPIYQIDAFAEKLFSGNPAAVCPLVNWIPVELMQQIASENNLSETAFFVKEGDVYLIRWFTPVAEVDLCGHATLASAHAVFKYLDPSARKITFNSNSGPLVVERENNLLKMEFPSNMPESCETPPELVAGLGLTPQGVWRSDDYLVLYPDEETIGSIRPDFQQLKKVGLRGVIITAPGRSVDFVSRFFAPNYGIDEDPVTGSAHTILTPFWAEKLGKKRMHARQLSWRGGELFCEDAGDRTFIAGRAVDYMQGIIFVDV